MVFRRPLAGRTRTTDMFDDEAESLLFPDLINRGIEVGGPAPRLRPADQLGEHHRARRQRADAGAGRARATGSSCTTACSSPPRWTGCRRPLPIVTLAGYATPTTANVHGDNRSGMRDWPGT